MNSTWEYFILCSICSMRYATCVFIPKQRNCGHLDLTKQSSANYTEICQLLFQYLFLSQSVDVVLWYIIDFFTRKSNTSVWIRISPRFTLKNDVPCKVCNKWILKRLLSNRFSCANNITFLFSHIRIHTNFLCWHIA